MQHMVSLRNGRQVPAIGMGTWYLGDDPAVRQQEIEALRAGINAGMTMVDTAEMYGSGRSESLVGEAIVPFQREKLFLVSKVLPSHANKKHMRAACEASLRRLKTDYLDLYLYHWRGGTPLQETVQELERLRMEGLIRDWGVSNFDVEDMEELFTIDGGENCLVNQLLYHTASRGIEYSLLPLMRSYGVALMSYCPLAQAGAIAKSVRHSPVLEKIAEAHGADVLQVMLAWNIRKGDVLAIPRSGKKAHVLNNAAADALILTTEEIALIEQAFPAPDHRVEMDML